MKKLDEAISELNYICESLVLLRQIEASGHCNNCMNRDCGYMPKPGEQIRYNCPFYVPQGKEKDE